MAYDFAQTTKSYISSIAFLDQREILDQVMETTEEERTVLDIMEITGRMTRTKVPEFSHFENTYRFKAAVITVIDVTKTGKRSGSTNLNALLTVGSGLENTLPYVGEMALFENKQVGKVIAVTPGSRTFEVEPLTQNSGDEIDTGTDLATSQAVAFPSFIAQEGSTSPLGRRPKFTRTENYIQIIKDADQITDLQDVSALEVNFKGQPRILFKQQHDTFLRFRMKAAFTLLVGKKSKNVDANDLSTYTTQGLWHYIKSGDGTVMTTGGVNYPLGGTIAEADLKSIHLELNKKRAPNEYWFWTGGELRVDVDDLFRKSMTGLQSGGIVYNSFGSGNAAKKAVDLGVNSYSIYGRTFHLKTVDAFQHPEIFAAGTFDYGKCGFMVPTGKIKTDLGGGRKERLGIRWMPVKGQKYYENQFGKLATPSTNDQAVLGWSYESIMGLQACGIKDFALITP